MATTHHAVLPPFTLEHGGILVNPEVAWLHAGRPPARGNVILLIHGISSSHHALVPATGHAYNDAGWASGWIGPGLVLDTERFCILAPNVLGSCFGGSGARSIDPSTGTYYGDRFPRFTVRDSARLLGSWLRVMGVDDLHAVVGYSYGGYLAFQWAAEHIVPCRYAIVLASAPRGRGSSDELRALDALSSSWRGARPGASWTRDDLALTEWAAARREMLQRNGSPPPADEAGLARHEARISGWAKEFDPLSMKHLRSAALAFDASETSRHSTTRTLWLTCTTDRLFPPGIAEHCAPSASTTFHAIEGTCGHVSPMLEAERWTAVVQRYFQNI